MAEGAEGAPRSRRKLVAAVSFLVVAAVCSAGYWYFFVKGIVYSDDARIDGDLVDLAPEASGTLEDVTVREGATVKAGQLLFTLDDRALAAALARAKADRTAARARVDLAQAEYDKAIHGPRVEEVRMAQAADRRARAETGLAATNWAHVRTLFGQGAMPETARDKARTELEAATRMQQQAAERLVLLRKGTRPEDVAAAKANVDRAQADVAAAEAAVHQAEVSLDHATVAAPFDGVVVRRWRDPGANVGPGTPVLTVMNPATLHVSANIEENDLGRIEPGDEVDVSVDAYPSLDLKGHVERVLRATNSQFSLVPSEGISGTYVKVVQRVPVWIDLKPVPDLPLGPGLSVEVRIHVGDAPAQARRQAAGKP